MNILSFQTLEKCKITVSDSQGSSRTVEEQDCETYYEKNLEATSSEFNHKLLEGLQNHYDNMNQRIDVSGEFDGMLLIFASGSGVDCLRHVEARNSDSAQWRLLEDTFDQLLKRSSTGCDLLWEHPGGHIPESLGSFILERNDETGERAENANEGQHSEQHPGGVRV